eukprot:7834087-Pyramimonas_sp.AAC.1
MQAKQMFSAAVAPDSAMPTPLSSLAVTSNALYSPQSSMLSDCSFTWPLASPGIVTRSLRP